MVQASVGIKIRIYILLSIMQRFMVIIIFNFFLENMNSCYMNSEVQSMHSSKVLCATMLA